MRLFLSLSFLILSWLGTRSVAQTQVEYDDEGRLIQEMRPSHGGQMLKSVYEYNKQGALFATNRYLGGDRMSSTSWTYDRNGNITKEEENTYLVIEVLGLEKGWRKVKPKNGTIVKEKTYKWDKNSNLIRSTTNECRNGSTTDEPYHTVYGYNDANQIVYELQMGSCVSSLDRELVLYDYDANGYLIGKRAFYGSVEYGSLTVMTPKEHYFYAYAPDYEVRYQVSFRVNKDELCFVFRDDPLGHWYRKYPLTPGGDGLNTKKLALYVVDEEQVKAYEPFFDHDVLYITFMHEGVFIDSKSREKVPGYYQSNRYFFELSDGTPAIWDRAKEPPAIQQDFDTDVNPKVVARRDYL